MALISSMGNSSSPLFLQSGESLGLNIAPLEYYYKKKEEADADLAKKLAQKPKLNEFDEKLDALPGQKESLKNIYNQKMGVVNKGVEKYGGIWAMYANSDEGQAAISSLNDMTYNMQIAEDNKKRFLKNNDSLTTEGGGNKRFLDKNFRAMVAEDGKSYLTNEGHQQFLMKTPGINNDGRLKELEFHRTIGTSKTVLDEVAALYSKVGETSWADSRYHAGTDEFGNVVTGVIETDGGASAFSYLNQVAKSGSSNKNQIDNAVGIISKSFSNEAKEGLVNELYDMGEGIGRNSILTPQFNEKGKFIGFKNETFDLNKFETDDQYRNNTINNYAYERANEIATSFEKSSASSTITMNTLGQTKSKSEIAAEKAKSEDLGHTLNIELDRISPTSSNTVTGYRLGDDGKYIANEYVSNDYTGLASMDAYASINKELDESKTPTKLSDMFAAGEFTIGDVNHKISAQLNPEVKKVIGIVTRNRNNTNKEEAQLLAAQEANRGKNPNTLNAEFLAIYNKNKALIDQLGPQKFMKVVVNTGDADASKLYSVVDKQTLLATPLASEVPVFGNNYMSNASESHGAKWVDYENQYESVEVDAYIPINLATGVYGNTEKQYHGNVAKIREINAANNKLLQNLEKSGKTNNDIMSSEK